jgi:hypothetical protein
MNEKEQKRRSRKQEDEEQMRAEKLTTQTVKHPKK